MIGGFYEGCLKGGLEIRADGALNSKGSVRSPVKQAIRSTYKLKPDLLFYHTVSTGKKTVKIIVVI